MQVIFREKQFLQNILKKRFLVYHELYFKDSKALKHIIDMFCRYCYSKEDLLNFVIDLEKNLCKDDDLKEYVDLGSENFNKVWAEIKSKYDVSDHNFSG